MMQPTPSQLAAMERHKSFHAAIAAKAVPERPAPRVAVPKPEKAALKHVTYFKPLPVTEPSIVWPVIPIESASDAPEEAVVIRGERPIRRIIRTVARDYYVTIDDILSERRTKDIVIPRHIAMFLSKEMTNSSLPDIGRRFGKRDHTTVLNAIRRISALVACDPIFASRVGRLRKLLLQDQA
jgi:Bacterial dnaA protein helix-turn-helix